MWAAEKGEQCVGEDLEAALLKETGSPPHLTPGRKDEFRARSDMNVPRFEWIQGKERPFLGQNIALCGGCGPSPLPLAQACSEHRCQGRVGNLRQHPECSGRVQVGTQCTDNT